MRKKLERQGVIVRTRAEVSRIITEKNMVGGVELNTGEKFTADHVVCTADTKTTFGQLLDATSFHTNGGKYYKKTRDVRMSPSGFSIHLGLDEQLDLEEMGFNCGYNVLTSSPDAFKEMFNAWDNGELLQSDDCFHMAVICPSLMTGGKATMIIHAIPVPAEPWIILREEDYEKYQQEKNRVAEFYIRKVEEYMAPGLRDHILFKDTSTPATFKIYIGSPTGSQYDMMPVPGNFGKNRLPTRTPVEGLFVPKFSHGIWPSMQAGLQVIDMITNGKIMNGNSSYKPQKA